MPFLKSKTGNILLVIAIVLVGMTIGWFLTNKNPPTDHTAELALKADSIKKRTVEVDSLKVLLSAKEQQDVMDRAAIESLRDMMRSNNSKIEKLNKELHEKANIDYGAITNDSIRRILSTAYGEQR